MNRLEAGKVFTATRQRSGSSNNTPWELIVTQDDRGNNEIAIFATNIPTGVAEGGKFRIEKISTVSYGNKKDANGNWRANVSINAEVVPVQSYEEFVGNKDAQPIESQSSAPASAPVSEEQEDGELPF